MSKVGWVLKELEETESEVNVLCNRYFMNCEQHWTEDREFVLELKGLLLDMNMVLQNPRQIMLL